MARRKKLADVVPPTAFVCPHVAAGEAVLHAYRDDPVVSNDSGWQFFCGRARERGGPEVLLLDELLERDPSLRPLLGHGPGTSFSRSSVKARWVRDK